MKPDIYLIADAALIALHENAKRLDRISLKMPASPERDALLCVIEAMINSGDRGRVGVAEIARGAL